MFEWEKSLKIICIIYSAIYNNPYEPSKTTETPKVIYVGDNVEHLLFLLCNEGLP